MGISRLYKFGTPYNAADLADLQFAQTANVAYFVHLDRPEQKLTRAGHTSWAFTPVTYGPLITAPVSVTATATTPTTTGYVATVYSYVVTAIDDVLGQESRASAVVTVTNDLTLSGNKNTISWPAVAGASRYAVYKGNNGVYGFIAGTEGLSVTDGTPIIIANLSDTPPTATNPFVGAGNYPSSITFHEQRKLLARTRNRPNALWGSQSGDFDNMDVSRPAKADDAYSFALVGKRVNSINQLVSSKTLLALTTDSVFSVTGGGDNAITPSTFLPKKQGNRGTSRLPAIEIDETTFVQPNQGYSIRALGFSFQIDGYKSDNISIFSPHLFTSDTIIRWAYQAEPYACIWAVTKKGLLYCFTWEAEQDVWGWTVCDTAGFFEDVATITEGGVDRVYVVTRRTINGVTTRFYERMALPHIDYAQACHLDCAVTTTYTTPTKVITGLDHLNGATVSAFYDGYAETGLLVTGGQVTLREAGTVVSVGLPYTATIETLPLVLSTQAGSAHTNRQTIGGVVVRALDTKGVEVAVSGSGGTGAFEPIAERQNEALGILPVIEARDYNLSLSGMWSDGATLIMRQTQPLPMHIAGLFLEPEVGDD